MTNDEAIEPCPPTTPSARELATTLQALAKEAPAVRDDSEVLELQARVERLKLENLALMRDEKAMRETKDGQVERASKLLEEVRGGRGLVRAYVAACQACIEPGSGLADVEKANAGYRALEEWSKKHP